MATEPTPDTPATPQYKRIDIRDPALAKAAEVYANDQCSRLFLPDSIADASDADQDKAFATTDACIAAAKQCFSGLTSTALTDVAHLSIEDLQGSLATQIKQCVANAIRTSQPSP